MGGRAMGEGGSGRKGEGEREGWVCRGRVLGGETHTNTGGIQRMKGTLQKWQWVGYY